MDRFHHDNESCGRGRGPAEGLHGFMRGHGGGGFRGPFGHGGFGGHGGGRARRGDVRTAVLRLLAEQPAPWDEAAEGDASGGLRGQMPQSGAAIWQIAQTRDADKIARAVAILSDTRKKLYAILSED